MHKLLAKLKENILVLDGAMGTELQKKGLEGGGCPEKLNLDNPEIVKAIHRGYLEAGSDIIQTNTFGANRIKLRGHGLADRVEEINRKAVSLVKDVKTDDVFISASMGPTGKMMHPLGELTFEEAYQVFAEQARVLAEAGADLINIETMNDLAEVRVALIAVKETTELPVICNLTYEDNLKTLTGTDPVTAVTVLEAAGADIIGVNCSLGPGKLVEIIEIMAAETDLPLCYQPNAGLPELDEEGRTVFPMEAEEMAGYIPDVVAAGAGIIGGCCGSGPEYIRRVKEQVKELKPQKKKVEKQTRLASRNRTVTLSTIAPTRVIGERINPTGRDDLTRQLKENKMQLVIKEAKKQVEAGADILDVNVGVPEIDQSSTIKKALQMVQNVTRVPVVIDTDNREVLEAGLQAVVGKPLINSVSGTEESLREVLPLASKYGAAVLGLTMDEDGIPETAEERYQIAKKIISRARRAGISKEDILIDTLTLAAGAGKYRIRETLKALRLVTEKLGVATVLGVSNVSYGMPGRNKLNATFLAMAINCGLTAPIIDPTEPELMAALKASDLLIERDPDGDRYLEVFQESAADRGPEVIKENQDHKKKTILNQIQKQVIKGDREEIEQTLVRALADFKPLDIINQALIPGIREVGDKYDKGIYYLPQLIMAAETMQQAFAQLKPLLTDKKAASRGKVLLATVKGDVHDIGKNIVRVLMENYGFEVLDLGKDVDTDLIVERAMAEKVDIIGLSTLMTTTMPVMREVTSLIKEKAPEIKIMVGGAVVTQTFAENIGADMYAKDAVKAVEKASILVTQVG